MNQNIFVIHHIFIVIIRGLWSSKMRLRIELELNILFDTELNQNRGNYIAICKF